jgi:hypothetical protein
VGRTSLFVFKRSDENEPESNPSLSTLCFHPFASIRVECDDPATTRRRPGDDPATTRRPGDPGDRRLDVSRSCVYASRRYVTELKHRAQDALRRVREEKHRRVASTAHIEELLKQAFRSSTFAMVGGEGASWSFPRSIS